MTGYRVAMMTVPDDPAAPRVVYLTPVDSRGRKTGPQVVGTLTKARADKLDQGKVVKKLPANLGAFTPPPKRPEPVE